LEITEEFAVYGVLISGLRSGPGITFFKDGKIQESIWSNNLRFGKGLEIFTPESYYKGDFVNGRFHGKGKFVY